MTKKIWLQDEIHHLAEHLSGYKSLVMVSGYFAVLPHAGHIALINEAKTFAHRLIVVINGKNSTIKKYGFESIPAESRAANLAQYSVVDYVLVWDYDNVADVIKILCPNIFCNGGDVTASTIDVDELKACNEVECRVIFGIGGYNKVDNTSDLIRRIRLTEK